MADKIESASDKAPGIGEIKVDLYKGLLSGVEGQQNRELVANLMRSYADAQTEFTLPAKKKEELLKIAENLKVSRSEDWKKSETPQS